MEVDKRLYNGRKEVIESYSFDINNYGISEQSICREGPVEIIFVNGKFDRVNFSFKGMYTREQWEVLAAIRNKIVEIEQAKEPHETTKR